MERQLYVGVDPGVSRTGWAVVNEAGALVASGVIEMHSTDIWLDRFYLDLFDALCGRGAATTLFALEKFSTMGFKASVINSFGMGRVVQQIISVLRENNRVCDKMVTHSNGDVRKWLCGNHVAKPAQVKAALQEMGYTERLNEHTRDALALALYARYIEQNEEEPND